MPFVYRYKDTFDERFKYIGIVKGDSFNNLTRRIKQHRKDDWFKNSEYYIDYIEVKTICDAQAIEGHLISVYQTYKYYNKAKKDWGESSLFSIGDDIWKVFGIESCQTIYREQAYKLNQVVRNLIDQKEKLEKECVKEKVLQNIVIETPIQKIFFDAIKQNLMETVERYEHWAINSSTKTASQKWNYRASKIRSAITIFEFEILEMLSCFPYSKEYQEDSNKDTRERKD